MAEVAAAFYAVETAVEGTAAGVLAVSGSTVPLHARFQRLKDPSSQQTPSTGGTADLLKNKLYIPHAGRMSQFSFPASFDLSASGQLVELDYELKQPEFRIEERPLHVHNEQHLDQNVNAAKDNPHHQACSVSCNDKIYILGGFSSAPHESETRHVLPLETILIFDTLRSSYSILSADKSKSSEGIPTPRYAASATISPYPYPSPVAGDSGPTAASHGTIFLHGGFDVNRQPLHDTWSFDIGARAWHKLPTIVEEALKDKSMVGQIAYVDSRLWYLNETSVMYLELAERQPQADADMTLVAETVSTSRVGTGQWQVVFPPPEADPAISLAANHSVEVDANASTAHILPVGQTKHVLPITTGAGRQYLLSMANVNPQRMHIFQIPSSEKTAASLKDTIRDQASQAIAALPDSWKSGKHQWSKVEVIQANKEDGELERPDPELAEFLVTGWPEYGDKLVIWGGQTGSAGPKHEGWVVHLD